LCRRKRLWISMMINSLGGIMAQLVLAKQATFDKSAKN
jgi:hypothetical protein